MLVSHEYNRLTSPYLRDSAKVMELPGARRLLGPVQEEIVHQVLQRGWFGRKRPVILFSTSHGSAVLKVAQDEYELAASRLAQKINLGPRVETGEGRIFLEQFVHGVPLGKWRTWSMPAETLGNDLAEMMASMHTAGIFYIDRILRHLYRFENRTWRLIDYSTAVSINDRAAPIEEVKHWLVTSRQSRVLDLPRELDFEVLARVHDLRTMRAEIKAGSKKFFSLNHARQALAAFDLAYAAHLEREERCRTSIGFHETQMKR